MSVNTTNNVKKTARALAGHLFIVGGEGECGDLLSCGQRMAFVYLTYICCKYDCSAP